MLGNKAKSYRVIMVQCAHPTHLVKEILRGLYTEASDCPIGVVMAETRDE